MSEIAIATYQACPIKRHRSTKAEKRRNALWDIVKGMKPMTVRQVFYQASVLSIVEKTEAGYNKVQTDLVHMRRAGKLPYARLADNTRWQRKPDTHSSIQEALEDTARLYRKALWADADAYVEVWLEKDALAGVVLPVTSAYDVPLMVARGYASLSFLHSAADKIRTLERPAYIYHFGDYDPSGVNAGEKIEQTLKEMAPHAEIHFERCAVLPSQIDTWDLPTRPTKQSDSRALAPLAMPCCSRRWGRCSPKMRRTHDRPRHHCVERHRGGTPGAHRPRQPSARCGAQLCRSARGQGRRGACL